ncbi:uncharacterized protein [Typha latifolia]|uniref:uncharacterized protein n=1 Tax=Typha latifolia TaxID=4733 RepID=UPI003C305EC4
MHQGTGSRRRVGRRTMGSDADQMELHRGEEISPFRNEISSWDMPLDSSHCCGSSAEENSFALEFRRNSSKKASGIPMKMLIDEEVSKNMQIRYPSPSVVARLMGLDSLPPRGVCAQQKKMESSLQASASVCSLEKQILHEGLSRRRSIDELPELKDVFEVMETSKVKKHKNLKIKKGKVSSKYSETDMDFIRQKFRDAKRLLSDELLQSSKELNGAFGALETNKDLFLEFLQEPNSLFTKHLHELSSSPPSLHPSQITILKPSNGNTKIFSRREKDSELFTHKSKEVRSSPKKPTTSISGHSFEHCDFLKHKLSKLSYERRTQAHVHPTRIVVLKPSPEKGQNMKGAVSSANDIFYCGHRKSTDSSDSGIPRLHTEGSEQQKSSDTAAVLKTRTMGSREIREQLRETVSGRPIGAFESELSNHVGNERMLPCMAMLNNSEALHRCSHLYDDWSRTFRPSTETSVSREARKRLSERWMMTHQFQELGPVASGSSTLGEMLALSDRETPRATLYAMDSQNETPSNDRLPCMSRCPLGISSKDGWKDENLRNLTRCRSLPALSTSNGRSKRSNRKRVRHINDLHMRRVVPFMGADNAAEDCFSRQGRSVIRSPKYHCDRACLTFSSEEENMLPEREIHVSSEESRISNLTNLAAQKPTHAALSCDAFSGDYQVLDISMVSECQNMTQTSTLQENKEQQQVASAILGKDETLIVPNLDGLIIEEGPTNHPQVDYVPSSCNAMEPASPESPNEGERPSPVSVLDPPEEEENSSSGCFGRISADLQELRLQLRLLKMESADTYVEEPELFSMSDEESVEDTPSLLPEAEITEVFTDEKERDYCYLLDMVICLGGVHVTDLHSLLHASYSLDCPVNPGIFSKLEKKYSELIPWPLSERKLLFDLINYALADMLSSCMDLQPWMGMSWRWWLKWDRKGLVEEVWQKVVRQREELCCTEEAVLEPRWLDQEGGIDIFVREIENMMHDDLLEDLIADIILW